GSHVCKGFLDVAHITRAVIVNDYHLVMLRSVIYCPSQLPEPARASKEQVVGISHPAGSSLTTGNTSLLTIPPQTNLPKGHSLYPAFPSVVHRGRVISPRKSPCVSSSAHNYVQRKCLNREYQQKSANPALPSLENTSMSRTRYERKV